MSHRSQSNLSALSLFDRAVSLELHLEGITTCIMQVVAFSNDTMLTDTLADIGESKAFSKKVIAEVVSAIKACTLSCKRACDGMVKPASKKDVDNLTAMRDAIAPHIAEYAGIVGPLVNKTPVVKTAEERAAAKQKSADNAAEKAAKWAADNGWICPSQVEMVTAEAITSAEVQRLQKLLDESREETATVSAKLAESVKARANLHMENAVLRGQVETLNSQIIDLIGTINKVRTMPKVSKAILSIVGA